MNAAQVTGERANLVRLAKEDAFHFNGFFENKLQQVIGVYYDDMIRSLVGRAEGSIRPHLLQSAQGFIRPIPLVLSGGTALPAGFRDRIREVVAGTGVSHRGFGNPDGPRPAVFDGQRRPDVRPQRSVRGVRHPNTVLNRAQPIYTSGHRSSPKCRPHCCRTPPSGARIYPNLLGSLGLKTHWPWVSPKALKSRRLAKLLWTRFCRSGEAASAERRTAEALAGFFGEEEARMLC